MTPGYAVMLTALVIAQLAMPMRYGFVPLLIAACHLGNTEVIPELTASRLIIIVGLARAISLGKFNWSIQSPLDRLFVFFTLALLISRIGHVADEWSPNPFANRVGLALNIVGTYVYSRTYMTDYESFRRFGTVLCVILIPLAFVMIAEMRTGQNYYYLLGSGSSDAATREDKIRAQGPFRGANTAGCVGATSIPFAYIFWKRRRKVAALVAIAACMGVTIACNSSGPLSAVAVSILAVLLWPLRRHMRKFLWLLLICSLLYGAAKGRGPWYLMARIDLVGGSTGYYRAELIDSAVHYLNEWWLFGTDHTRHWMSSGVSWSPNHTDMTNYYIHLGVIGGLPLTICLFAILFKCFQMLGRRMLEMFTVGNSDEVILWCAGTSLAAHAVSFIAISYYDQMSVFFYMLIATIPALVSKSSDPTEDHKTLLPPESAEPASLKPLRYYS